MRHESVAEARVLISGFLAALFLSLFFYVTEIDLSNELGQVIVLVVLALGLGLGFKSRDRDRTPLLLNSVIILTFIFVILMVLIASFGTYERYFNHEILSPSLNSLLLLSTFLASYGFPVLLASVRILPSGGSMPSRDRTSKCPNCGKQQLEGWRACPYCGADTTREDRSQPKSCKSCGKPMESNWVRCPHCGVQATGRSLELVCPSCRKPVKQGWKKCPHCATDLELRSSGEH